MTRFIRLAVTVVALLACCTLLIPAAAASIPSSGACAAGGDPSACDASLLQAVTYDPYTSHTEPSGPSRIQHMWTTPLLITRPPIRERTNFNRVLSEHALTAFRHLQATRRAQQQLTSTDDAAPSSDSIYRGDDADGVNEQFFNWQRDQHRLGKRADAAYLALSTSVEFQGLLQTFGTYAKHYLETLGKASEVEESASRAPKRRLFCWATVSSRGNYHLTHTHPDHALSGVYYSRVPRDAGRILFDDPRGPRWPFDGRLIHTPEAGDLILFPSWLAHQVTPTQGTDERISWSCNFPGAWTDLSDINLA